LRGFAPADDDAPQIAVSGILRIPYEGNASRFWVACAEAAAQNQFSKGHPVLSRLRRRSAKCIACEPERKLLFLTYFL